MIGHLAPAGPERGYHHEPSARPEGLMLDVALIRERRLSLGISLRRLAMLLGPATSAVILRGMEEGGNHPDLTFGEVQRICQVLGLRLRDVVLDDVEASMGSRVRETDAGPVVGPESLPAFLDRHVPRAGGVLAEIGRAVSRSFLAELLGLSLDEVDLVLAELVERGRRVGWDVFFVHGDVGVRAAPPLLTDGRRADRALVETAWRRDLGRRGLTTKQASLVADALAGREDRQPSNDTQVQTSALVNAGILIRDRPAGASLSRTARYSLLL